MIRLLGEELILISLYHSFEKQINRVIRVKHNEVKLKNWDEIKNIFRQQW